jgi:predicted enzyme related to lactoylglutathione lyase
MTDHGLFHWNELMTHDAAKAKKFYTDTVGWTFEDMEMPKGTYSMMKVGDKFAGGIFEMKEPELKDVPEKWVPYLSVDDVDARLKKASAAGATILRLAVDVPGVGRFAILQEPGGAVVGFITPAAQG